MIEAVPANILLKAKLLHAQAGAIALTDVAKVHPGLNPKSIKKVQPVHRKPTMSDVARLASVGTMTVSRVLSGSAGVTEETSRRVHTAVEQLGYRPNELARAFRGQRTNSIGLIIPYLYDSFFANCAHAVTTVAKERGYSVIITTSNEDPDLEFAEAERMLQRHVDGLVLIPSRFRQSRLTRSFLVRRPLSRSIAPWQISSLTPCWFKIPPERTG